MKKNLFIGAVLCLTFFQACEKHDDFDKSVMVGEIAPQVYWEIDNRTVTAGQNVNFKAQYYTTNEKTSVDHMEVWYNISETEYKSVNCPWMVSTPFSYVFSVTEEKRVSQKITEYGHSEDYWEKDMSAFFFENSFPTSNTLGKIQYAGAKSFGAEDSAIVKKYFGENFMEFFKDSLYDALKSTDFQKMFEGLNLVENFKKNFLDSTLNENTGAYDYHFPITAGGETPVPEEVQEMYRNIPFADLIFSPEGYAVQYEKSYFLQPAFKVFDTEGNNAGTVTGETMQITLN